MCNCMIQSVRVAAQLGSPPEKFYTNASKSMNVLKLKTDRKTQSLTEFVYHVYDLVSVYEKIWREHLTAEETGVRPIN